MIKVRIKDKIRLTVRNKRMQVVAGGQSIDPLQDNVRDQIEYMIDNEPKVGNLVLTTANNIRQGVGIGSNGDEIEGNLVVPAANNLRNNVGAGANGNEVVGNIILPVAANLL